MPLAEDAALCQAIDRKNNCIGTLALEVSEITICSLPL